MAAPAVLGFKPAEFGQQLLSTMPPPDVAVLGAGVLGLWSATYLQQKGLRVTIMDPWEPGHSRGTSTSEHRIIRCSYGTQRIYTIWAWKSLRLWAEWEREWGQRVLYRTGVLWMVPEGYPGGRSASEAELERQGIPYTRLSPEDLREQYPQINPVGLQHAVLEPESGALLARESILQLTRLFRRRGGRFLRGRALPGRMDGNRLVDVRWGTNRLAAGTFVFACGPWLPQLFPDVLSQFIRVTRQEELYFGVPAGSRQFDADHCPCWIEEAPEFDIPYGIPALEGRGFRIGKDSPGPAFDPDESDRTTIAPDVLAMLRAYLARRFPALASAPLVASRVCQYALTPDNHLLVDRHPALDNVWLVGGGSGHGFKLGPALGEYVAAHITGDATEPLDPQLQLGDRRFQG